MIDTSILHYRITGKLGAGAMGEVYLAHDERTDRKVALKFVGLRDQGGDEACARLVREARAAARLTHTGIVTLFGLEDAEGKLFLVQEFVAGETLAVRLQRGPLSADESMRLARELSSALAHAHTQGVLHRDLKPDNVLVTEDGHFKIADFGIARVEGLATVTTDGSMMGTLPYMAPERLAGGQGDERADLFALGAILYEAITGTRAFPGDSQAEVLYAVMESAPVRPAVATDAQPMLALALHLLSKTPEERPRDGDAVRGLLETWATTGAMRFPMRRRRVRVAVTVGVALATVAGLGLWGRGHVVAEAGTEPSVAVLPFINLQDPSDPARTGSVAGTLLVSSLAQPNQVNVLRTQSVIDAVQAVRARGRSISPDEAMQVARRTHAGRIVTGTILQMTPQIVVSAEVIDVASDRVLHSAKVEGCDGATVFQVVDQLGSKLLGQMVPGFAARNLAPLESRTGTNLSAYEHFVNGQEKLARGEIDEAGKHFEAAVALDSTLAAAYYQLGVTQWWGGEPGRATSSIEHARRYGSRLTPTEGAMLDALAALVDGHWGDAESRLRDIDRRWPDDKQVLYGLVEATYHGGHPDRTIVAARRALRIAPTFLLPTVHLVDALALAGRSAEAERIARQTLARDPHFAFIWHSLYSAKLYQGDGLAALDVLRQARAAGVKDPMIFSEGGHLAIALDSLDTARRYYEAPDAPAWRQTDLRRGVAFKIAFVRGNFRQALRIAEDAWAVFPRTPEGRGPSVPMASGCNAAMALGDGATALMFVDSTYARYARAKRMPPAELEYSHAAERASMLAELGSTTEAAAALLQLRRNPVARRDDNPTQLRMIEAEIALKEKRGADALALLSGPVRYQRGFFMYNCTRLMRARAQMLVGDYARAQATLDTLAAVPVLRLDDVALVQFHRGQCLEKLGRPADAAAAYTAFLQRWTAAPASRPEIGAALAALKRLRVAA